MNHWCHQDKGKRRGQQLADFTTKLYTMEAFAAEAPEELLNDDGSVVGSQQREKAVALLHKLHRAAGHPPNRALARLCKDRGMPAWMQRLALELECQACVDTLRGEQKILPVSLGSRPAPWQVVSLDVMELVFPAHRCISRFLVMVYAVMKFVAVKQVWQGPVGDTGIDSGQKLAFVGHFGPTDWHWRRSGTW